MTGDLGVMWFVTCLFLATVAYEGLRLRLGEPASWPFVAAMAGILAVAYPVAPLSLPWNAAVVPMALVFMWMGEVWRRFYPAVAAAGRSSFAAPATLAWLAGAATLAILGLLLARPFDMKFGLYGTPVLSVAAAAGCIHVVAVGCRGLSRRAWFNHVFSPLGRASLVIFFLHRFFILHLEDDLPLSAVVAVALLVPFAVFVLLHAAPPAMRRVFLGRSAGIR